MILAIVAAQSYCCCLCRPKGWKDRVIPGLMIVFLSASILCALIGGRANAKRTLAFEEAFCKEPEGLLWKQFTRLGKGKPSVTLIHHHSYVPGVSIIDAASISGIMASRH